MPSARSSNVRRRRRWFRFGVWDLPFAVPILLLCGMFYSGCANWAILHPTQYRIGVAEGTRKQIPVSVGGVVEVWTARTSACADRAPAAYVLRFCGNGERAENALQTELVRWSPRPVEIWAENHPGYGGSTVKPILANLPPAAIAAFDALKQEAGSKPIFLAAHSLGNTDLLYVSAHRHIAGALVHDPPPLRQLIVGKWGWWNLWILAWGVSKQVPASLDTIANARRSTAPAVFITGDHDSVIPPKYQTMIYNAYAGPKRRIFQKNADHNDPIQGADEQQLQADIDWLWTQSGATHR